MNELIRRKFNFVLQSAPLLLVTAVGLATRAAEAFTTNCG